MESSKLDDVICQRKKVMSALLLMKISSLLWVSQSKHVFKTAVVSPLFLHRKSSNITPKHRAPYPLVYWIQYVEAFRFRLNTPVRNPWMCCVPFQSLLSALLGPYQQGQVISFCPEERRPAGCKAIALKSRSSKTASAREPWPHTAPSPNLHPVSNLRTSLSKHTHQEDASRGEKPLLSLVHGYQASMNDRLLVSPQLFLIGWKPRGCWSVII